MLRLCGQCGEDVPPGGGCPRCGAPAPRWVPVRRKLVDVLGALFMWLAMTISGLACLLAAFAFLHGWIGPGLAQRILQVVIGVIVVGAGVPVGLMLLWGGTETLFERSWIHPPANGRGATAITRFGRVVSASGGGRAEGPMLTVPGNALSALETFGHYGALRTAIGSSQWLRGSPPRVDLALLASLLSLAGRQRVQLRVSRQVSWSHNGKKVSRHEQPVGVEVRRTDALSGAASEDFLEARLLDALAQPTVTIAQPDPVLPYRAAAVVATSAEEAPWIRLPQAIFAMSQGDPRYRRGLRVRLESMHPQGAAARSVDVVSEELLATMSATGNAWLGAVILHQLAQGFSMREPIPAR